MTCGCLPYVPCDAEPFVFDDFNRTELSGLGISSSGTGWSASPANNGTDGVGGGSGILTNSATFSTTEIFTTHTGVSSDFGCLVRFLISTDAAIFGGYIFNGVSFGWHGGVSPYIVLDDNNGNRVTQAVPVDFWDTLYDRAFFRAERIGSIATLKLWSVALGEGSGYVLTGTSIDGGYSVEHMELLSDPQSGVGIVQMFTDNIAFYTPGCAQPTANQPIEDEFVAVWDGVTTVYQTNHPYNPQSLEIEAAGEGVQVDPTGYATGLFTLLDVSGMAPDDEIRATYLRAEWI